VNPRGEKFITWRELSLFSTPFMRRAKRIPSFFTSFAAAAAVGDGNRSGNQTLIYSEIF
jgi:hypothetical protein